MNLAFFGFYIAGSDIDRTIIGFRRGRHLSACFGLPNQLPVRRIQSDQYAVGQWQVHGLSMGNRGEVRSAVGYVAPPDNQRLRQCDLRPRGIDNPGRLNSHSKEKATPDSRGEIQSFVT